MYSSKGYLKLKIKTIDSNTIELKVESECRIKEFKKLIEIKLNVPIWKQRLIFQGKVLNDENYLSDYKLEENNVIHLVEQTINSSNENLRNERSERTERNSSVGDRLSSLTDLFLNSSNVNSSYNQILNNNNLNFDNDNIPDSYKNLKKLSTFNKIDSIEVIKQNINNIKEIINNTVALDSTKVNSIKNLFIISNNYNKNKNITYKVGQWVDVKDTMDNWQEGRISEIINNKAKIIYQIFNELTDEWISVESPRITLFRTYTVQSPFVKFNSPFPNKKNETNLIMSNIKEFDKFDNFDDLVYFMDNLREKIMHVIVEKEAYYGKKARLSDKFTSEEELLIKYKLLHSLIMQLYPLLDRVGRLFTDFANYLFYYSFKNFDDEIEKFKSNMESNLNFNGRENLDNKIISFHKFTQLPVMRNSGEVAENHNLHRPRIGIVIGLPNVNPNINRVNRFTTLNYNKEINFQVSPKIKIKPIQIEHNNSYSIISNKSNSNKRNEVDINSNVLSANKRININKNKISIEAKDIYPNYNCDANRISNPNKNLTNKFKIKNKNALQFYSQSTSSNDLSNMQIVNNPATKIKFIRKKND